MVINSKTTDSRKYKYLSIYIISYDTNHVFSFCIINQTVVI